MLFKAFYLWQQHVTIDPDTDGPLDYRSNVEDFLGKTMRFLNRLEPYVASLPIRMPMSLLVKLIDVLLDKWLHYR